MKSLLLLLGAIWCASCSSASQGRDASLPAFDPFAYVTMPKDPSAARRAVRLLNTSSEDPSRAGITESPDMTVGKLGRLGFALLAEEIRERGMRSSNTIFFILNNRDDPLVVPALFEKLVQAKSEAGAGRLTLEILNRGIAHLDKAADRVLYTYLDCLNGFGRNSVPYLRECMRSDNGAVRQIAWDLLNIVAFLGGDDLVYQLALERAKAGSNDWERSAEHFASWWDGDREKLGWNPKSYSFKSP